MKTGKITPLIKPLIAILAPLLVWLAPAEWLLPGMNPVEHRVLAIFAMAALFWILEPIPIFATSILIIALELILVSDQGFILLRENAEGESWENLLRYQDVLNTFASPVVMLLLGGFFLAMAAAKFRLDQSLAGALLKPFGTKPGVLLLGLMLITAVFSMFMSNTATTAMMLSILVPVLLLLEKDDPGRVGFTLGIPFAANIGGIGTPIGTPVNAIAIKYMTGGPAIGFGQWMLFALPFALIMLLIAWRLLLYFYPAKTPAIQLQLKSRFVRNPKAYIVYITFVITLALWLTDFLHGMNAYVVSMIPVAVFLSAGIVTREDLKGISWDVLWLVAGGIALGLAMEESGLARRMVSLIPLAEQSAYLALILAAFAGLVMSNFISNTGTANLLLPIAVAMGGAGLDLSPLGGVNGLVLGVALSVAVAMSLPVSTPPNALAHAAGGIQTGQMAKTGAVIGLIGLAGAILLVTILRLINFFPA